MNASEERTEERKLFHENVDFTYGNGEVYTPWIPFTGIVRVPKNPKYIFRVLRASRRNVDLRPLPVFSVHQNLLCFRHVTIDALRNNNNDIPDEACPMEDSFPSAWVAKAFQEASPYKTTRK